MECNCVRKITEGLFRKYKILYTLAGGPLNFLDPKLQPIEPIGKSGTGFTALFGSFGNIKDRVLYVT